MKRISHGRIREGVMSLVAMLQRLLPPLGPLAAVQQGPGQKLAEELRLAQKMGSRVRQHQSVGRGEPRLRLRSDAAAACCCPFL